MGEVETKFRRSRFPEGDRRGGLTHRIEIGCAKGISYSGPRLYGKDSLSFSVLPYLLEFSVQQICKL